MTPSSREEACPPGGGREPRRMTLCTRDCSRQKKGRSTGMINSRRKQPAARETEKPMASRRGTRRDLGGSTLIGPLGHDRRSRPAFQNSLPTDCPLHQQASVLRSERVSERVGARKLTHAVSGEGSGRLSGRSCSHHWSARRQKSGDSPFTTGTKHQRIRCWIITDIEAK